MQKALASYILAAVLLLMIIIPGCAKKEPEKPAAPELRTYFPLTQGSSWEYEGEGNEYASFTREVLFAEGNRGQIWENNGGTASTAVFETSADAVTRINSLPETYEPGNMLRQEPKENTPILKAPLEVGNKWTKDGVDREIVALDAVVSSPAGTFEDCLKIKITNTEAPEAVVYEYYKQNVGLVKREFISGETTVTSTLAKYTVK